MKTPFLTVITPVYNGERFIESCLQSVISQNCPDVEHLIIDGGSTDRTLEIIKSYIQWNPHLRLVSKRDHGQSDAMNRGITLARGKVIGFLNCDDYYQPSVLSRILEIFQTLPAPSLLVGNCNILNDDERIIYLNKPSRLSLTNILIGGENNQFPFNPSAYFYHKSLHVKIGLYDESDHYTMDLDFIIRAVKTAHVQYVDETWGNFRYIRGTKTFESRENGQLEPNKMRVMNMYLEKLPGIQRWWVKINQFLFVQRMLHYYASRVKDCLKNPMEIYFIMLRKIGYHSFFNDRKPCVNAVIENNFSSVDIHETVHV
jgi:glycosyltransferase involved in cell wall biosynthesis